MGYRALVTIMQASVPEAGQDYRLRLDDDFTLGEEVSHLLASKKNYFDAYTEATGIGDLQAAYWSDEERASYLKSWADQYWQVEFDRNVDMAHVTIRGFSSAGELIFMRRTNYYVGLS